MRIMCITNISFKSLFDLLECLLTIEGVVSIIILIARSIHNNKLPTWKDNVSITDHESTYDVEQEAKKVKYSKEIWEDMDCSNKIVFRSIGGIIPKLEVIKINCETGEANTMETYENIKPDEAICFLAERAETQPRYKLRWYSDYGEYAEHLLTENLRNGFNEVSGVEYKTTLRSKLRKLLGFS